MPRKQSGQKKKQKEEAKKQKKGESKVKVDPTFGLKNKKGSKNRRFVQNAQHNMNAEEIRKKEERAELKRQKALEQQLKREEEALFKTVDKDPSFKKKKKNKNDNDEEENKVEVDDETLLNECPADELDELIDRLRVKFENRSDLTPVNPETFVAWQQKKEQEKLQAEQEKVKKKMAKRGKKGLTGRELFSLTPNIFQDDEDATEDIVFEKEEKEQQRLHNIDEHKKADKQTPADETNEGKIKGNNHETDKGKQKEEDTLKSINEIGDASLFLDNDDLLNDMEIID
mmetsp:Transcript_34138/g.54724  ORF Transcript_34138/g.54724 Transcript_34138/m.54724 type:complete len:286 (+) Transcript_34138:99-956(+)|eukprot:CAMPEP_0197078724 /NCGR_PEP_ID=MMETSP1384-20130603/213262_1 /TAXON_ID=29189 /ORGANISM="Ammonia sp." /LENGTH=285 /DNA_ID=CAMNT_0042517593 /DNA_START=78 /DNA_END=935 /DNA_ORIENTATION=-